MTEDQKVMLRLPSRLLSDTHSTNFYVPGGTKDYMTEKVLLLELSKLILKSSLCLLTKDRLLKLMRFMLNGNLDESHPEYLELGTNLNSKPTDQ